MAIKYLVLQKNNKSQNNIFTNYLNATDEYGVENTHSIIRSQTYDRDDPELLRRKAKAICQSTTTQHNYRKQFTPPKSTIFLRSKLHQMKFEVANLLTDMFSRISDLTYNNEFNKTSLDEMLKSYLPNNASINTIHWDTIRQSSQNQH